MVLIQDNSILVTAHYGTVRITAQHQSLRGKLLVLLLLALLSNSLTLTVPFLVVSLVLHSSPVSLLSPGVEDGIQRILIS